MAVNQEGLTAASVTNTRQGSRAAVAVVDGIADAAMADAAVAGFASEDVGDVGEAGDEGVDERVAVSTSFMRRPTNSLIPLNPFPTIASRSP